MTKVIKRVGSREDRINYYKSLAHKSKTDLKNIAFGLKFPIKPKRLEIKEQRNRLKKQESLKLDEAIKYLKDVTRSYKNRELIKKRDNYSCRLCGDKVDILEVHHLTPKKEGGDNSIFNLISVCKSCHLFLHCNPKTVMRHKEFISIGKKNGKAGRPEGSKDKYSRRREGYYKRWEINNTPPIETINERNKNEN